MSNGIEESLHDAAVLHRLADVIEEYCKEQERSQTYADASGVFFGYVETLAQGIKSQLKIELNRVKSGRLPLLRAQIWVLKGYLRVLHGLIKPAADAHTLTIPAPLIALASQQLQAVEGMKDSQIVILLTSEFMYFQRPHTDIKNQGRFVEGFIPAASFPAKLGFIELPYSQGPSFFTNLAIYHEIGHFVFEELSQGNPPLTHLKALRASTRKALNKAFNKKSKDGLTLALGAKILEYWTQEVFCDLFAIRLVGPAFSFALIEILAILGALSQAEAIKFYPTHPASAFRFAEHLNMLCEDSWWPAIGYIDASQKSLIETLAAIPRSSYSLSFDDKNVDSSHLVNSFLDFVVPAIRRLVRAITKDVGTTVMKFEKARRGIEECLAAGVVPHTPPKSEPPDPISIINSTFGFYLKALPDIIEKFDGPTARNDVEKRSEWTKRLEMWTMKAIEDFQIQDQFRKLKGTALWSSLEMKS